MIGKPNCTSIKSTSKSVTHSTDQPQGYGYGTTLTALISFSISSTTSCVLPWKGCEGSAQETADDPRGITAVAVGEVVAVGVGVGVSVDDDAGSEDDDDIDDCACAD